MLEAQLAQLPEQPGMEKCNMLIVASHDAHMRSSSAQLVIPRPEGNSTIATTTDLQILSFSSLETKLSFQRVTLFEFQIFDCQTFSESIK